MTFIALNYASIKSVISGAVGQCYPIKSRCFYYAPTLVRLNLVFPNSIFSFKIQFNNKHQYLFIYIIKIELGRWRRSEFFLLHYPSFSNVYNKKIRFF